MPAALLDVDGTLVDTNYHHALAWYRAFRGEGLVVPVWRLHRHVGMGGDRLVAAVAGDEVEDRLGDRLRDAWRERFDELLPEVAPLEGAAGLVRDLRARGLAVVLASSSIQAHLDAFVDLLGVRDDVDGWTTADDVEQSKPAPDLVEASLERAGTREAALVGDTPWDCRSAADAGIPCVCVMTGGFSEAELREGGAVAVFGSIDELRARLDETPFGAAGVASR